MHQTAFDKAAQRPLRPAAAENIGEGRRLFAERVPGAPLGHAEARFLGQKRTRAQGEAAMERPDELLAA